MRTVLHIFLNDVRQMRWTLALWLALLTVQVWSCLSESQKTMADWDIFLSTAPKLPVWTVLHWLGLVVLTFEVILADRPCDTGPFWRTRPIARWQMATAKLVFLAVFTVLLPGVLELLTFTRQGVAVGESARGILFGLLAQVHVLGWMVMLAILARRRTLDVLCLAPLSVVLPFLVVGCWTGIVKLLEEWEWAGQAVLSGRYWHSPPDFHEPASHLQFGIAWACTPGAVALLALVVCYLRGSRPIGRGILVGTMLTLALAAPVMLLLETANPHPAPVAAVHTNTATELNWRPEWQTKGGGLPGKALNLRLDVPVFAGRPGTTEILLPQHGWATMRGRLSGSERWRTLWSTAFPDELRFGHFDAYERLGLTRTNGPLGALLRAPFHVLNPPAGSTPEITGTGSWYDTIPLTRFGELHLSLRFTVEESSVMVVRREPFRGWAAEQREWQSESGEEAAAPQRNVVVLTPHLDLPIWQERSAARGVPRHALLWHPERRELVLPAQTTLQTKHGPHGVLAFACIFCVQNHTHRSVFPRLEKLLPDSGISERDWLAGAEVLLLAFQPVTTRHRIIEVPDVPLPPVSPAPPKP